MKRTVIFLILALSASMGAWAQVKIDGIYYNLNEEAKTAEVTKPQYGEDYSKYSGDIVIPASVTYEGKDYAVTSLGNSAFSAFYDITSIALPTSLRNIGNSAFANCNGLSALEIPNGVKIIGESAFFGCQYLTSIVIPNSVDSIGRGAFQYCRGLVSVKFGSGLKSVGRSLFTECTNLVSIEISNDNPYYDSREGCNAIIETCTNKLVAGCNTTIVPSSVKSISTAAFMYCTFTSFELPDGLEEIENFAFYKCKNLTDITIPASVKSMGYSFYDCSSLVSLKVDSNNKFYDSRDNCNAVIETATNQLVLGCKTSFIPNSVTSIGDDAFGGCRELPFIELPSGLTSIGADAFAYCTFTSVTIPDGVTTIGVAAFSDCRLLKTVSLPQSLTSLGLGAFSYCDALTSIYIYAKQPPTVTKYVGTGIYDHCTLYVPEGSEEAYAAADGWKDFKNIVAMTDENTGDNNTEIGIAINATNFPDEFFRGWLLSQAYGKDGVLTDKEIAKVTEMDMSKNRIYNLEGIGYFTELKTLTCDNCDMSQLDLSHCPKLESLSCSDNKLTELDLSSCPSLTMLQCTQNQLTSINLSGCSALQYLQCHGNQLTTIDLSDCKGLVDIDCGSNLLTAIDVSSCTKLKLIRCDRNQLTAIDVSACKDLLSFDCQENQLTTLNVSGLSELSGLLCGMNALTSINISGCSKLQYLFCEFNDLGLNAFQHIVTNIPEFDEGNEAFMLIYSESPAEGVHDYTPDHNICSKEQVTIAKAKGWQVLCYTIGNTQPYEGVEVAPETDYHPLLEEGKVWTYLYYDAAGKSYNFARVVEGDTIIGGQTYKRICNKAGGQYQYGLREEGKKVYIVYDHYETPELLYDFSKEKGDIVTKEVYGSTIRGLRVADVDTIDIDGVKFRRMRIVDYSYDIQNPITEWYDEDIPLFATYWIEGVGSEIDLESNYRLPGNYNNLLSCQINGRTYTQRELLKDATKPSEDYYYYYRGNKIPLTLNEDKVVVSIPKDDDEIIERLDANIQTLGMIQDETFDIHVVLRSEYEKLTALNFWTEDAKSVIITLGFYTERNEEVYSTPYLSVKLKKEEDIDLLSSYAEQYGLRIVKNMPSMPLWYILSVTSESEKSPLVCANELYESGNFASSEPDLAFGVFPEMVYHPFVEDGKVWKVGALNSGNPVQWVEYFYFDGDTIINELTCKQMMCQRYVSPDFSEYNANSQLPSLSYVGAWCEKNKRVYLYDTTNKQFKLMYDFSLEDNGDFQMDGLSYVVGRKQTGGIKGFKGVYRDVRLWADGESIYSVPWLEGVGSTDCPTTNVYPNYVDPAWFLMSCSVGDEVIYLNDEYEDGTISEGSEGKKRRIDFDHTVKIQPKAPHRAGEDLDSLYGEYNNQQLDIKLNPLDDAYLVRITDKAGQAVYEKTINAGNIVALNINISEYPEGQYTVTIENSKETFTGEFDTTTTAIKETTSDSPSMERGIFNLNGQRVSVNSVFSAPSVLPKGVYIVDGKKIFVK